MSQHPAYLAQEGQRSLVAMVTSVFQVTSDAKCLRLVTTSGTISAWLKNDIIVFRITPGQVWRFKGQSVHFEQYGEQFEIHSGIPSLPVDSLLIPFLAYHVPGLTRNKISEIWKKLGGKLIQALESNAISSLAALIGKGRSAEIIASLTIQTWKAFVVYDRLAQDLYRYEFNSEVLHDVIKHYRERSTSYVRSNPYRLLAFADFALVDQVAKEHFKVDPSDDRRLLGAVDAAIHLLYDEEIEIFSQFQLKEKIQILANLSSDKTARAIGLAVSSGRVILNSKTQYMSDGLALIKNEVNKYLTDIENAPLKCSGKCELPKNIAEYETAALNIVEKGISVIIANETTAIELLPHFVQILKNCERHYHVVAKSNVICERIELKTGIRAITLENATQFGFTTANEIELRRTIIIVSSSIGVVDMAKLLEQLRRSDQLIFFGQNLNCVGERALLFPELLVHNNVYKLSLCSRSTERFEANLAQERNEIFDYAPRLYSSAESHRKGIFWVCIRDDNIDRAVVGVSHQLRRHGSTMIVTRDTHKRRYFSELIEKSSVQNSTEIQLGVLSVSTANNFEPGETSSAILVVESLDEYNRSWIRNALLTCRDRAVLISTAPLDETKLNTYIKI